MLPSLGLAAAFLLSGAQAAVPRLLPRSLNGTATTIESTDSTSAVTFLTETTVNTPGFTTSTSLTGFSESTGHSTPTVTSLSTDATSSSALTLNSDGGITISGVITIPSASLPTSFETTGTAAFVGLGPAATNAGSSFSNVAAAASAMAANPSPSIEDVRAFQEQAQDNFEEITALEAQVKEIDRDSLDDDDSHKVEAALAGLAALLGWYSTQLSALVPVLATPALATAVFADLAPAFAAAAAGDLLANALDDLEDLDDDDDDDDDNDSTTTDELTSATSTETSTTTSATSSCSAIPYTLDIPDDDDDDRDMKRSLAWRSEIEERGLLVKRAGRPAKFGTCAQDKSYAFPNYPKASTLESAEKSPKSPSSVLFNTWSLKWYDRFVDCTTLAPGWKKLSTADAKAANGGISRYTVDHIWELKFFNEFFSNILGGQITCDEFDKIFRPDGKDCILKRVIAMAPSSDPNPEFMAILQNLNGFKGRIFNKGKLQALPFVEKFDTDTSSRIQALQDIGAIVSIFNDDEVRSRFERTNQRMYDTFLGIDNRIQANSIPIANSAFRFSDAFEAYMAGQLAQGTSEAWNFVKQWTGTVENDLAAMDSEDEATKELQANYDAFKASPYASEGHYTFLANTDLSSGAAAIAFKRDLMARDDGSCPFDQPTSTAATAESTTGEGTSATDFSSSTTLVETTATTEQSLSEQSTATSEDNATEESTGTTQQSTTPGVSTASAEQTTEQATEQTTEQTKSASDTPINTETTSGAPTTTSGAISSVFSTPTTFSTAISSDQSTSEDLTSEASTSTHRTINAHTVTSNGMVCVLIDGSLHPVCTPLETPTANPDGTNVHVNSGCILINGSPRCASDAGNIASVYESSYNVASNPDEPYSTTLILSGFDSSNDNHLHSTATCQLQARWPANYGDIYFGEDGCLYDSESNKIFDQCCSTPDSNNSGPTTNPYVAPAPPDASQSSGNHDGSSICRSFGKDTCLAAASRYVDDIVYHQYTSAVWPDSTGADIANAIFPIAGPIIEDLFGIHYGCTVIWTCDDDDAFAQGMTGKQIKDSMLNIYNLNGAKGCGSSYLDNRCHITVNGCNNCRDEGRDGTIWNPYDVYDGSYGDANDGFPPRR